MNQYRITFQGTPGQREIVHVNAKSENDALSKVTKPVARIQLTAVLY